ILNGIDKAGNACIIFIPLSPYDTRDAIENLCNEYNKAIEEGKVDPLILIPVFIHDFLCIHPFMDGNGRVGRMLIPLYLYYAKQIETPCFFISEALEHDKLRYYNLLNNIRERNEWNEWIKFFLDTVARQCEKYINIVSEINKLYDSHVSAMCEMTKSSNAMPVLNSLYRYPVITAKQIVEQTKLPATSVNRLLKTMVEENILITDGKKRNTKFVYYGLLDIIR
ncbi:MAG: Fic family protein, partial [Enterococcus sp.]|nr:Fic family protein [Enterococcus sp.]